MSAAHGELAWVRMRLAEERIQTGKRAKPWKLQISMVTRAGREEDGNSEVPQRARGWEPEWATVSDGVRRREDWKMVQ